MASPTSTGHTTGFRALLPKYWDTVLGENLYPNLYFYQFGTKRTLPRNFGKTIIIPRVKKQNIVQAVPSEGVSIATCPLSDQLISGTLAQFAGAYKHSDLVIMTALSDVIELSLIDIARDIARRMDRTIRNALSGIGATVSSKTTILKPTDIITAVVTLDKEYNPRPPDNHYPTIIHPVTVYDIQTNLSGGAWLDVTKYQEIGAPRIYTGEIGRMYGARFVTSGSIKRMLLSTGGTASGVRNYMFAPDSYYVTEINDMTARTFVKQLGSAGAADPVNQFATVGAKVFFGIVPATWTNPDTSAAEVRLVKLQHPTTIAGGDLVS